MSNSSRSHRLPRPWTYAATAVIAAASLLIGATPSQATLIHEILADNSTVVDNGNGTGTLYETDGSSYNIATKQYPGPDVNLPVVSYNQAYQGLSSLEFVMTPYGGTQKPGEKSMIDVARLSQGDAPGFNEWRGMSFAINLDSSFQNPTKNLMLAEWWQGSPMGPPVQLSIMPNSTQWEVGIINNKTLSAGTGPIWYPGGTVQRGVWHTITMMVYPNYASTGEVQVYEDGSLVMDITGQPIGFDPSIIPPGATGHPPTTFNVCLGLYRQADFVRADVYYDRIRYADSYADL